jgi:hypothetical protein
VKPDRYKTNGSIDRITREWVWAVQNHEAEKPIRLTATATVRVVFGVRAATARPELAAASVHVAAAAGVGVDQADPA